MCAVLKVGYAVYPSVKLRSYIPDTKNGGMKLGFIKELLFGDFIQPYVTDGAYETITIPKGTNKGEYIKVRCRGADGYIKESEMQTKRILEVNFIDVGQGDGCHVVTPDDKHFIIDAGYSDNMYRYLKWRFNLRKAKSSPPPFTVVISHSDQDHYQGFGCIFSKTKGTENQFTINKIYHNGIVEGVGGNLGPQVEYDSAPYVTDLCKDNADYKARLDKVKHGPYINMLEKCSAEKEGLWKGSDDIYNKGDMRMEILGPVPVEIKGKAALPWFGDSGKTKNGNSVIIKLTIGHLRLMLGGDLNKLSEDYLLKYYSGKDVAALRAQIEDETLDESVRKNAEKEMNDAIDTARQVLEVDIAKSCHHGSADFTSEFLRALNPLATIISSGDDESYAHPRPDTLGTIGKFSRGDRSLIFSTELARSGKEFLELKNISAQKKNERVVTVYGMINVRTDGDRVVIAQKLERPSGKGNWDIHKLVWNKDKEVFEYIKDPEKE